MKGTIAAVGVRNVYGEFVCANPICEEGEYARRIPPIFIGLPVCPGCGCESQLVEVLRREGEDMGGAVK